MLKLGVYGLCLQHSFIQYKLSQERFEFFLLCTVSIWIKKSYVVKFIRKFKFAKNKMDVISPV